MDFFLWDDGAISDKRTQRGYSSTRITRLDDGDVMKLQVCAHLLFRRKGGEADFVSGCTVLLSAFLLLLQFLQTLATQNLKLVCI